MTDKFTQIVALGKEDVVAELKMLLEKAKRGEVSCVAMRKFKPDGTFEDVVLGGTEEDRAKTLKEFKKTYAQSH